MSSTHCRKCGAKLIEKEMKNEGIVPYCPECEEYRFPQYNVAVSMIVVNKSKDEILLIQQYGRQQGRISGGRGQARDKRGDRDDRVRTQIQPDAVL